MKKKLTTWSLLALFLVILGAVTTQAQNPAKLRALTIWRDDQVPPVIHCRLTYKGVRGRRQVDADAFCQANLSDVKALGQKAFKWARDNPIEDPAVKAHLDGLEAELEAAGYTVTPP